MKYVKRKWREERISGKEKDNQEIGKLEEN